MDFLSPVGIVNNSNSLGIDNSRGNGENLFLTPLVARADDMQEEELPLHLTNLHDGRVVTCEPSIPNIVDRVVLTPAENSVLALPKQSIQPCDYTEKEQQEQASAALGGGQQGSQLSKGIYSGIPQVKLTTHVGVKLNTLRTTLDSEEAHLVDGLVSAVVSNAQTYIPNHADSGLHGSKNNDKHHVESRSVNMNYETWSLTPSISHVNTPSPSVFVSRRTSVDTNHSNNNNNTPSHNSHNHSHNSTHVKEMHARRTAAALLDVLATSQTGLQIGVTQRTTVKGGAFGKYARSLIYAPLPGERDFYRQRVQRNKSRNNKNSKNQQNEDIKEQDTISKQTNKRVGWSRRTSVATYSPDAKQKIDLDRPPSVTHISPRDSSSYIVQEKGETTGGVTSELQRQGDFRYESITSLAYSNASPILTSRNRSGVPIVKKISLRTYRSTSPQPSDPEDDQEENADDMFSVDLGLPGANVYKDHLQRQQTSQELVTEAAKLDQKNNTDRYIPDKETRLQANYAATSAISHATRNSTQSKLGNLIVNDNGLVTLSEHAIHKRNTVISAQYNQYIPNGTVVSARDKPRVTSTTLRNRACDQTMQLEPQHRKVQVVTRAARLLSKFNTYTRNNGSSVNVRSGGSVSISEPRNSNVTCGDLEDAGTLNLFGKDVRGLEWGLPPADTQINRRKRLFGTAKVGLAVDTSHLGPGSYDIVEKQTIPCGVKYITDATHMATHAVLAEAQRTAVKEYKQKESRAETQPRPPTFHKHIPIRGKPTRDTTLGVQTERMTTTRNIPTLSQQLLKTAVTATSTTRPMAGVFGKAERFSGTSENQNQVFQTQASNQQDIDQVLLQMKHQDIAEVSNYVRKTDSPSRNSTKRTSIDENTKKHATSPTKQHLRSMNTRVVPNYSLLGTHHSIDTLQPHAKQLLRSLLQQPQEVMDVEQNVVTRAVPQKDEERKAKVIEREQHRKEVLERMKQQDEARLFKLINHKTVEAQNDTMKSQALWMTLIHASNMAYGIQKILKSFGHLMITNVRQHIAARNIQRWYRTILEKQEHRRKLRAVIQIQKVFRAKAEKQYVKARTVHSNVQTSFFRDVITQVVEKEKTDVYDQKQQPHLVSLVGVVRDYKNKILACQRTARTFLVRRRSQVDILCIYWHAILEFCSRHPIGQCYFAQMQTPEDEIVAEQVSNQIAGIEYKSIAAPENPEMLWPDTKSKGEKGLLSTLATGNATHGTKNHQAHRTQNRYITANSPRPTTNAASLETSITSIDNILSDVNALDRGIQVYEPREPTERLQPLQPLSVNCTNTNSNNDIPETPSQGYIGDVPIEEAERLAKRIFDGPPKLSQPPVKPFPLSVWPSCILSLKKMGFFELRAKFKVKQDIDPQELFHLSLAHAAQCVQAEQYLNSGGQNGNLRSTQANNNSTTGVANVSNTPMSINKKQRKLNTSKKNIFVFGPDSIDFTPLPITHSLMSRPKGMNSSHLPHKPITATSINTAMIQQKLTSKIYPPERKNYMSLNLRQRQTEWTSQRKVWLEQLAKGNQQPMPGEMTGSYLLNNVLGVDVEHDQPNQEHSRIRNKLDKAFSLLPPPHVMISLILACIRYKACSLVPSLAAMLKRKYDTLHRRGSTTHRRSSVTSDGLSPHVISTRKDSIVDGLLIRKPGNRVKASILTSANAIIGTEMAHKNAMYLSAYLNRKKDRQKKKKEEDVSSTDVVDPNNNAHSTASNNASSSNISLSSPLKTSASIGNMDSNLNSPTSHANSNLTAANDEQMRKLTNALPFNIVAYLTPHFKASQHDSSAWQPDPFESRDFDTSHSHHHHGSSLKR